jgi:hypothetical protein
MVFVQPLHVVHFGFLPYRPSFYPSTVRVQSVANKIALDLFFYSSILLFP